MSARRVILRTLAAVGGAVTVAGIYVWFGGDAPSPHSATQHRDAAPREVHRGAERNSLPVVLGASPEKTDEPIQQKGDDSPRPNEWALERAQHNFLEREMKGVCPWPPNEDTWRTLDNDCLVIVTALYLNDDYVDTIAFAGLFDAKLLRAAFEDPRHVRNEVVAALDRPECRVPEGESRPELKEACSAESMVVLATTLGWCGSVLSRADLGVTEWHLERDRDTHVDLAASQPDYYERMDLHDMGAAAHYWALYMCRAIPRETLLPLDYLAVEKTDSHGQESALFANARRLGCEKIRNDPNPCG